MIRVLLVEDHALVRAGFRALFEKMAEIEIAGEAGNGLEALERLKAELPDVALVDVAMPELGGLETLVRIRAEHPSVRVILLSVHDDEEYVWQALASGASGYLLKSSSVQELEIAIRSVAAGGTYLTPSLSRHVFAEHASRAALDGHRTARLSPRQRSIVRLVARGLTSRGIANELGLSIKTVESHRTELMARLGVHEVAGLVRYAVRTGLIDPGE